MLKHALNNYAQGQLIVINLFLKIKHNLIEIVRHSNNP